ncbi:MAG: cyclopropane-fatty-acyl-phospholipid synthase family protein [Solirubrobacterales bacterium]|nr:cyclopropane-fatty-acyl-phospholipid synthase family protein [Solirubrobacterales bacterium]
MNDQNESGPAGIAGELAASVRELTGATLPVTVRAWDGSTAGPSGGPVLKLNSPRALTRLLWSPGELGLAQAYITGEIEVDGNLEEGLDRLLSVARQPEHRLRPDLTAAGRTLRRLGRSGAIGLRPPAPASQARVRGRLHSLARDRQAISHHYDLSNRFYELILDDSVAYSCAWYADPEFTLAEAQQAKLDLVCRKLGLTSGSTLLDIGCGWGSLSLHAAERFGAEVTAVTISAEQHGFVSKRVKERGLEGQIDVRLEDYRETDGEFDAVSSIEMGEHVGEQAYPGFVSVLQDRVRPGGRVLIQQMSRRGKHPGGGPFIESFIAPDMHMRPVGETVGLLEAGGLEVRDVHALREHYVRTVHHWIERFETNLGELRQLVPEEVIRVWRLYLTGGAMAFRDGRMGVDQILSVRPGKHSNLDREGRWQATG